MLVIRRNWGVTVAVAQIPLTRPRACVGEKRNTRICYNRIFDPIVICSNNEHYASRQVADCVVCHMEYNPWIRLSSRPMANALTRISPVEYMWQWCVGRAGGGGMRSAVQFHGDARNDLKLCSCTERNWCPEQKSRTMPPVQCAGIRRQPCGRARVVLRCGKRTLF